MNRGDIYLVSLDPASGHEQKGMRPVLVVSPGSFNKLTKTPMVVPITTGGNFARVAGFTVDLVGSKTVGVARCDQLRVLDLVARKAKKLEGVSTDVMDEVLAKLSTLIT
ncbi:type II toxin-antitoxin system PemK/MazF family toxin [Polynucleobacter arcticus]|uniref:Pemk protein n=1 Tax=Polynucleobacter arcticus TaxID=1743165 RepID=A0A6M9PHH8_9BURK|nr:type II toxin-antitoxin system PemK/MazF family toxin [Polynucleobacter arcticus]QKM59859.1 pemk protein [Polynucleobacter arcticus]